MLLKEKGRIWNREGIKKKQFGANDRGIESDGVDLNVKFIQIKNQNFQP